MSSNRIAGVLIAAFLSLFSATSASAGELDVSTLLEEAKEAFDLEQEDAVFLLDELSESWTADGRRVRGVHQLVLIRTEYGIDHHADLRIPWDSARQRLILHSLCTWRASDDRWIESGPTAMVETLPFAVDGAPDYCHLRETMLLHDGVELPCVM